MFIKAYQVGSRASDRVKSPVYKSYCVDDRYIGFMTTDVTHATGTTRLDPVNLYRGRITVSAKDGGF